MYCKTGRIHREVKICAWILVEAQDLAHNTSINTIRVEPFPHLVKSSKVLLKLALPVLYHDVKAPTSASIFLTDLFRTSREFFVQCGRHGKLSIKLFATFSSVHRLVRLGRKNKIAHTKRLVEALVVANVWSEGGE